jgi:hypothetical protein
LRWAIVPSPNGKGEFNPLSGIACAAASACMAVGGTDFQLQSLAERWNGSIWSIKLSPEPGLLNGVACVSAAACMAVGDIGDGPALTSQRWNGSKWIRLPTPYPATSQGSAVLFDVACTGVTDCTAVGYYGAFSKSYGLIEHWDGSKWSIIQS